jgi:hypothetical protein
VKNIVTTVRNTQLNTAYSRNEQNTAGKQEATGLNFTPGPSDPQEQLKIWTALVFIFSRVSEKK